ncbi:serine protease [Pontibacter sp. G13]|uniref:S1C family serine protease n=1 Tax=Pontibacter sp. G13 TaxID=3074898 RepID=UPI00288A44A4|nr:serine protease [Pontibacter sp. G13]WNJ21559.1 serine protease [Pontibacter sp. G13]
MKHLFLTVLVIMFGRIGFGQQFKPTSQSNNNLKFEEFLAGVKYAEIVSTPELERIILDDPMGGGAIFMGIADYISRLGFEKYGATNKFRGAIFTSICDKVLIYFDYSVQRSRITDLTITFVSCDNEWWQFKSKNQVKITLYSTSNNISRELAKMYGYKKRPFNKKHRRKLPSEMTIWTEGKMKAYFISSGASALEGIYEKVSEENGARYKVGVIREDGKYKLVYFGGANNYEDWTNGEVKAKLIETATPNLFKSSWVMANKTLSDKPYITFETGSMNVVWPDGITSLYLKLFPTAADNLSKSDDSRSSGTGFAIAPDGYIITNQHVVESSRSIVVKGINGDFSRSYNAIILAEDKNNDLAILKIDLGNNESLGLIPYSFNFNTEEVGSDVYSLGFPLRATMGDEVKLTNGILSSKTGFKGDITTYQTTVAVQPGNSGGPLINENGEVIGIISAKHSGADNVTYAVKASYLKSLIQVLDTPPQLSPSNRIAGKKLSEQVGQVKDFVYILEVN